MSLRFNAISNMSTSSELMWKEQQRSPVFLASNVFTLKTAREYLSDEGYKSLLSSIKSAQRIDRTVAGQIANGIKAWAENQRSYTFYPLVPAIDRYNRGKT